MSFASPLLLPACLVDRDRKKEGGGKGERRRKDRERERAGGNRGEGRNGYQIGYQTTDKIVIR